MTLLFIASNFLIEQPTNILTGQGKHCEHFEIKNCKTTTTTTTTNVIARITCKRCLENALKVCLYPETIKI